MSKQADRLIRIYTGTEISVIMLQGELEQNGISAMTQNDFSSSVTAGFVGGSPSAIDLFVQESDIELALPIIDEFNRNMNL